MKDDIKIIINKKVILTGVKNLLIKVYQNQNPTIALIESTIVKLAFK